MVQIISFQMSESSPHPFRTFSWLKGCTLAHNSLCACSWAVWMELRMQCGALVLHHVPDLLTHSSNVEGEIYIWNKMNKLWEARGMWLPQSSQNCRCITSKLRRLRNGQSSYSVPSICFPIFPIQFLCYTYTGLFWFVWALLKNEVSILRWRNS